jgi:hypothetical protein
MRLLLILLTLLCTSPVAHAETHFLKQLDDVPLAPGLKETDTRAFAFDGPTGRIDEAVAVGQVQPRDVRAYYAQSLPSLGWKRGPEAELVYHRPPERLTLQLEKPSDGLTEIRFRLVTRIAAEPAGR